METVQEKYNKVLKKNSKQVSSQIMEHQHSEDTVSEQPCDKRTNNVMITSENLATPNNIKG